MKTNSTNEIREHLYARDHLKWTSLEYKQTSYRREFLK